MTAVAVSEAGTNRDIGRPGLDGLQISAALFESQPVLNTSPYISTTSQILMFRFSFLTIAHC
jgi:hypothetical protein